VDETTTMPDLAEAEPPLRIDFSELKTINSYGIRKLIKMIREWSPREFEYHAVPSSVVETFNVVRALLGEPATGEVVKSYSIPHFCEACDKVFEQMFDATDVKIEDGELHVQDRKCPTCGRELEIDVEPDEYFVFLES
jgi:hypothetical protein